MEFQGNERFEVLSYLGEGAMGVVYCCLDHERHEQVAVKTLRDLDGEALFRFKNEFRAIQGLQHPNLVSLGELIEVDGSWFFTMELVEGQDFLSFVTPRARTYTGAFPRRAGESIGRTHEQILPPTRCYLERLQPAFRQLAEGLAALHTAGRVHRDIKPSNVLVTREGRVVILDFGFVTTVDREVADREIVGTAAYMAPEQASSSSISPAADWYAAGVILFEALVGRAPIEGSSMEVLMAKQHREIEPPSALVDGVPEELDTLCAALLAIEPEKRPRADKILALLGGERLSLRSITASSMSIRGPEFVGRKEELLLLGEAYDSTAGEHATGVFILGESGIGKTALVDQFCSHLEAGAEPPVTFFGRCYERESVPYKAFDGVIDALSRFLVTLSFEDAERILPESVRLLAEIFPVLRRVEVIARHMDDEPARIDPAELRSQVFQSVRELFSRLRDEHRMVIVIDDLQWADGDSVALLSHLFRGPGEPAVLLIGTVRTDENTSPTSPMTMLQRVMHQTHEVRLSGLDEDESMLLAGMLFQQLAPHRSESAFDIIAESGGHPLFIDEMIRFVLSSGRTAVESLHLEDALWTRISTLELEALDVLDHIVVAGEPIATRVAAAALKMTLGEFGRWVAVLRVANLVRTNASAGDTVEIFHDRVRAAVQANLDRSRRRHCHERLALALEMVGGGRPEALAKHWRRAGKSGKAYKYLLLAAKEAENALAFDRAANIYRQSLELLSAGADDIPRVKELLGDALANAGRAPESANAYLGAARATGGTAVELQAKAAGQLLRSGHVDSGLAVLADVLPGLGMKMPATPRGALMSLVAQRVRIRLRGLRFRTRTEAEVPEQDLTRTDIAWAVSVGLGFIDTIRGAEFQAQHLLLALHTGEPYRVARALAVEAAYRYTAGPSGKKSAERVLRAARDMAQGLERPHVHALIDLMAGIGAVLLGRWLEAVKLCDSAERMLRGKCHNVLWETSSARVMRSWGQWYTGALHVMQRRMPELISSASAGGDLYAETTYRSYFLPLLMLAKDRAAAAAKEAEQAMGRWSQQGFHFQHYVYLFAVTQIDLYRQEFDHALQRIHEQWPRLKRSMILQVQQNRIEALHFRARCELAVARASGDDKLLRMAERRAHKIRREGIAWGAALAGLLLAGVADTRGDEAQCARLLEDALGELDAHDMNLYAAATRRLLGTRLGGDRGATMARQAQAWFAKERVKNPAQMTRMLIPGIALGSE